MTALQTADAGTDLASLDARGRVRFAGRLLVAMYATLMVTAFIKGIWLIDLKGRILPNDFLNVWTSGRLVLAGKPATVYNWPLHKAAEVTALGHPFGGYFGWHYPPPLLFAAAVLAFFPYFIAQAVWIAATLPGYVAAIGGILRRREAILLAFAFPAAFMNVWMGQNGLLTAALIGGALLLMEKRPIVAGILLGLLTYKPQFGLLFPIVLIAGRHWRMFGSAAVTAVILAALSWAAFGSATWLAFFHSLAATSEAVLGNGVAGWNKLQSVFGLVRWLGGGYALALGLQATTGVAIAALLCVLWRKPLAFEIKAAALAAGTLLVTPYVYIYDLAVLAVPMAFLIRLGSERGFLRHEVAGLALAAALVLVFPWTSAPVGLAASLAVLGLTLWRAFGPRDVTVRNRSARPSGQAPGACPSGP